MKFSISFILVVSFSWCVGLKGLIIPQNAHVLSTAGTGIAAGVETGLNPAMKIAKHAYIQFSLNRWLGDIKGSHISFHWGDKMPQSISIQTWNATDLQLWGKKPDSSPLGTFGVHYISTSYSISHNLNTPYRFGIRIQANYNHLYTESMSGITLDGGVLFPITYFLSAGVVVRNLGYEYTNNLRAKLPGEIGFGTELQLPLKIYFLTDAIYLSERETELRMGIRTNFKWLNLHAGISNHENKKRSAHAFGFSLHYKKWLISYGIYHHENTVLGLPQFLDVRRNL